MVMGTKQIKRISVEQFADMGYIRNRRGHPVSAGYLYRLIRQHNKGLRADIPFSYEMTGEKDRIFIITK